MVFTERPALLFPQMQRGAFEELRATSPSAEISLFWHHLNTKMVPVTKIKVPLQNTVF